MITTWLSITNEQEMHINNDLIEAEKADKKNSVVYFHCEVYEKAD